MVSLASGNPGVPSSGFIIITIGKISTAKDINKPEIHRLY